MKSSFFRYASVFLLIAIFGVLLASFLTNITSVVKRDKDVYSAYHLQEIFAKVANEAIPAVVIIKTGKRIRYLDTRRPSRDNPYDYLLHQFLQRGIRQQEYPSIPSGQGSGFFVNTEGYLVTGYHVIKDQTDFNVITHNGAHYKAEVVGTDPKTDLAVLRIKTDKKTPYLDFADSQKVKVGHWAIAVGAPFSLDYTVTAGIVSHKGRSVGMNVYENYIQTDASVNPGNSGGPLLNLEGKVIGINDFIFTSSPQAKGNIGLSFAIASDLAKQIIQQLINTGKVTRPWLGIVMINLTESMKRELVVDNGVLVASVSPNDPAAKAGIEPGDVITKVDGTKVDSSRDVQLAILKRKPGDRILISIDRKGKVETLPVIAERQDDYKMIGEE